MHASDKTFAGPIPQVYDALLVPLFFAPYAADLAARVASHAPRRVLELAAGTGAVTRRLAAALPASASIVATDLNPAMLETGVAAGTARPVEWQAADALALPFGDAAFDVVACQFGVMFFPDKARAFAEARRVLAPGGTLLFNVWDRLEDNAFAAVVTEAVAACFPGSPPGFLARTPHGYHTPATIERDLREAGFTESARIEVLGLRSRADSAAVVARAICHGTPLRSEIEAHGPAALDDATAAATAALERRFGPGPVEADMRALVVGVARRAGA